MGRVGEANKNGKDGTELKYPLVMADIAIENAHL
jgi:hypothetical protein